MALNLVAASKRGHPWQPGQSGNPAGKPKDKTLQQLCRAETVEAVKTLIVMMRHKGPNQLPATLAILDRGWGRPKQVIEAEGGIEHTHLHLLAAKAVSDEILSRQSAVTINASAEQQKAPSSNLLDAPPPLE